MLHVQNFLKNNPIEKLEDHGIDVKEQHGLYILNYKQFDSSRHSPLVGECRGLILDKEFNVVAYPFHRFYNYGEVFADEVDFTNSVVLEKRDGTLITNYYNPILKDRAVSTRGNVLADCPVNLDTTYQFKDLYLNTMGDRENLIKQLPPYLNLAFELTSPLNKIVTNYDDHDLRLLAVRDINTLSELPLEKVKQISESIEVPIPKIYSCNIGYNAQQNVINSLEHLKSDEEGYVVVDYGQKTNGSYHRVKVKNPIYISLSIMGNAGNEISDKWIFDRIINGEKDEILVYFPEYKEDFERIDQKINKVLASVKLLYNQVKDIDRKDIAGKSGKFKGIIFDMINHNKSAEESFRSMSNKHSFKLLEAQ